MMVRVSPRAAAALAGLLLALLALMHQAAALASPAPPRVVVGAKPLHSIVARVMVGAATPHLLLPHDPHSGQLRPSDAAALAGADLIVWVGPGLERALAAPVARAPGRVLTVAALDGLDVLPRRGLDLAPWGPTEGPDPHVWLDPARAARIAGAVAARLAALDPARAPLYRANAEAAARDYAALDDDLRAALAPAAGRRFLAAHDALQYLEVRYNVASAGALLTEPEAGAGAGRLATLRGRIRDQGIGCVLAEPGPAVTLSRALIRGGPARLATIDPDGMALPPGPDLYPALMRALARDLAACLTGNAPRP